MTFRSALSDLRFAPAVVLAASVAILGAAFGFQYLGGLQPCVLCIYQRYPYGIAIALSLLALTLAVQGERAGLVRVLIYMCGVAFLAGAGFAVFHVGVEQHWWRGTSECGATSGGQSLEELKQMLEHAPVVRCDAVAWSLFGISMAGYNALLSLLLAAFALIAPGHTAKGS